MNRYLFVLVLSWLITVSAYATSPNNNSSNINEQNALSLKVDRSTIHEDSVIRLTLDVQFDLGNSKENDSTLLNSLSEALHGEIETVERQASGYKITVKLPIAEEWRKHGDRLKITIFADTEDGTKPSLGLNVNN